MIVNFSKNKQTKHKHIKNNKNKWIPWKRFSFWAKQLCEEGKVSVCHFKPCSVVALLHAHQLHNLGKLRLQNCIFYERWNCSFQTHPQWNFADLGCTDFRVSPVHLTWYQSSQSSHCTQSTSLSWLWGWRQSTQAQVLYM